MSETCQQQYNLVEYDSEEERRRDPVGPTLENLSSAAAYIGEKIMGQGGAYALIGGFALMLLGSPRATRDVDIVTDLTMAQVWSAIEGDLRIIVPNTRLTADIIKVFVKTGSGFDECRMTKNVEVDIALRAFNGTGSDIRSARTSIQGPRIKSKGQTIQPTFFIVAVPHLLKMKMRTYGSRGARRDLQDVTYLLQNKTDLISSERSVFDQEIVLDFLEVIESEELLERIKKLLRQAFGDLLTQ